LEHVMLEPLFWGDVADWVRLGEKMELIRSHRAHLRRKSASSGPNSRVGTPAGSSSVPQSRSFGAPDSERNVPATRARHNSNTPFGWLLVGVHVTAWMRWEVTGGSPSPRSRNSSLSASGRRTPGSGAGTPGDDGLASAAAVPAIGSTYVTFQIKVRSSVGTYNVHKSLAEVQALRAAMVSHLGSDGQQVPVLVVAADYDRDEATLDAARRALEIFLQSVVGVQLFECAELFECLAEQGHPQRRVTSDRMVACSDPSLLPASASAAVASGAPPRSDNLPIAAASSATPRRAKDRLSVGAGPIASSVGSVGNNLADALSKSISTAEADYFAAVSKEQRPASGASSPITIADDAEARKQPASSPSHHTGSYLNPGDDAIGSDSDDAAADSDDEEKEEPPQQQRLRLSVLEQPASSGVLSPPPIPSVRREDGPTGSHRFTVVITEWQLTTGQEADVALGSPAAAAAASTPSSKKSGGEHVVYVLVIREFFELSNYLEWSVRRRFAQFASLHSALEAHVSSSSGASLGAAHVPRLPSKTLLTKTQSASFLNKRRQQLEVFLQQIINTNAFQCDAFFSFFAMNNPTRHITMGNINRERT